MIEITTNESARECELIVDGFIADENEEEFSYYFTEGRIALFLYDVELVKRVLAHRFCDLPAQAVHLGFPSQIGALEDIDFFGRVSVDRDRVDPENYVTNCEISFDFEHWKRPWSASEYGRTFESHFELDHSSVYSLEFADNEYIASGLTISTKVQDAELVIQTEVAALMARRLHEITRVTLSTQLSPESLTTLFDFPEEVRVPCEQYLLYFVQFLRDLGVEASAEIRHDAGQVLFAVTPSNSDEALDKIRTALETYLSLPMGTLTGAEGELHLQQLASNVYHLKSQLALAHAVIQAKDATIHAQQFSIIQQERLLSGEIIVDSIKRVMPDTNEGRSEAVLDGIAEITKYEGKGFNVNLPEIYRRLRRLFSE